MAGFIGAGALAGNATVAPQAIASHASTAIGDILVAQLINKSSTANVVSPPDGTWTKVIEGTNAGSIAAHRHQYTVFWKRATVAGAQSYTFTKATDDNVLFAGVISTFRNVGPDATTRTVTVTTTAGDAVAFPDFDPTDATSTIIWLAWYGLNLTTFNASLTGSNPFASVRYDLESATGTTATLAMYSGDATTGAATGVRSTASASTTDACNTAVVFALTNIDPVPVVEADVFVVGKTVTIKEAEVTPVAKATVTVTGKTVATPADLVVEVVPVTKADVTVTGQTVTIPADSVPTAGTPGSDDVRFSSTRTRLNVRQGLLYRSQTISAPIVSAPSADITPVSAASVIFTGKPVLVLDTEPVLKATVLFTGQTVAIGDTTQPGNNDVQFASTRTRLNVRQGLLYRSLTTPGRPPAAADTVPVTQASVGYTGQTVTIRETDVTPVLKATVLFTGKTVLGVELGAITKATVSLIGKVVLETETIPLTKATVTVTGKTVTVRDFEVTPVAKATVTVFGKPITEFELIPVNKGSVIFTGQTVALVDPGVDRTTVDPAAVTLTGKTIDPSTEITKAAITFAGKTVTVRDFEVTPVLKASVVFTGKTVTVRDFEVTPVAKATVLYTGKTVTLREAEVTPVLKGTVTFAGQSVTPTDLVGDVVPISRATILFSGQEVLVTDTGVQPPIQPPLGGGGAFVPSWRDPDRKRRRRYRALEEIEKRIDARIEKLKAETKEKQQQVAEVISQPGQIDVLSQQFAELLRQQALITGMLLEAQRRAEAVRQERIQLAILAQRAAEAIDEEEAITMLLLT